MKENLDVTNQGSFINHDLNSDNVRYINKSIYSGFSPDQLLELGVPHQTASPARVAVLDAVRSLYSPGLHLQMLVHRTAQLLSV